MVFFPVSVIINSKTIIRLSEVIDLKRLPLRKEHAARLAEYGLQNIPLNACCCLRFSAGEEVLREGQPIGGCRLSLTATRRSAAQRRTARA